jgi:hypothetical protein
MTKQTYEFTLWFTHGYIDHEVEAKSKKAAIARAIKDANAWLSGDDDGGMYYHSSDEAGELEVVTSGDTDVFESPDHCLSRHTDALLEDLELAVTRLELNNCEGSEAEFIAKFKETISAAKGN